MNELALITVAKRWEDTGEGGERRLSLQIHATSSTCDAICGGICGGLNDSPGTQSKLRAELYPKGGEQHTREGAPWHKG